MRESARSQGHRIPGLLSGEKKKEEKNRDAKNGGRDANIFASRQSQRGESVQKVSLRQRQVITYVHIRTKMEFKVEVNYLVGI